MQESTLCPVTGTLRTHGATVGADVDNIIRTLGLTTCTLGVCLATHHMWTGVLPQPFWPSFVRGCIVETPTTVCQTLGHSECLKAVSPEEKKETIYFVKLTVTVH